YIFLFLLDLGLTHAQAGFKPATTWASASVAIEGKAFYIQSGRPNNVNTQTWVPQLFAIDLAIAWDVQSPAYIQMRSVIEGQWPPNALLPDGITWVSIKANTLMHLKLTTGQLERKSALGPNFNHFRNLAAAWDPTRGEMVIPGGFIVSLNENTTVRLDPNLGTLTALPVMTPEVDLTQYYSIVSSESAKAMFYFGGLNNDIVYNTFARLAYGGTAWQLMNIPGGPSARAVSCFVSAYNGAKLVLFGGEGEGKVTLSDIYIFDVASEKWERGRDGGPTRARAGHSCAISGDNLVIFGGYAAVSNRPPVQDTTSVFNLKTMDWQDRYTPSGLGPDIRQPGNYDGSAESGGANVGAIAGGIAAVVLLVVAVVFIMYRRRQKKKKRFFVSGEQGESGDGSPTSVRSDSNKMDRDSVALSPATSNGWIPTATRSPQVYQPSCNRYEEDGSTEVMLAKELYELESRHHTPPLRAPQAFHQQPPEARWSNNPQLVYPTSSDRYHE
ncbi:hypothetical protein BGZ94_009124, partial [Podila epigama]